MEDSFIKKYLILDGSFEGARLLSGAISAAYVLSKGLPPSSIAELKMIQFIATVALEYPTGLIADIFGRRTSLLISTLFGSLGFACFAWGASFEIFAIAELCMALCLCFWSGAYEAYATEHAGLNFNENKLHRFFHWNSAISSLFVIATGFLGSVVATWRMELTYQISVLSMLGIFIYLLRAFPRDHIPPNPNRQSMIKQISSAIRKSVLESIKNSELLPFVLAFIFMQIAVQPLIYYWQPWFQNSAPGNIGLGFVFIAFQSVIFGSSLLMGSLSRKLSSRSMSLQIGIGFIFSISLFAMVLAPNFALKLCFFSIAEAVLTISLSLLKIKISQNSAAHLRASVMSFLNLMGKLAAFISLAMIRFYLKTEGELLPKLDVIYNVSGVLVLIISSLGLFYMLVQNTKKRRPILYATEDTIT